MEINLQTKIAALLEAYPALEETLLELSPAFAKLRNPVLRRTVAKVATIRQAAQMAGISPPEMVQALRQAAGLSSVDMTDGNTADDEDDATPPEWFDKAQIAVRYDITPLINSGDSPMQEIIRLSKSLQNNEIMELTTPFKPVPIMDLLKSKGFQSWYFGGKVYFWKQV